MNVIYTLEANDVDMARRLERASYRSHQVHPQVLAASPRPLPTAAIANNDRCATIDLTRSATTDDNTNNY